MILNYTGIGRKAFGYVYFKGFFINRMNGAVHRSQNQYAEWLKLD